MTFDLIPQVVIIISIGIIIVIIGRNVPKINNLNERNLFLKREDVKEKEKFFYLYKRMKKRINKEEYKEKIGLMWIWFEKVLRKTRIRFLRIDNKIIFLLDKLREKNIETEVDKNEKNDNINEYKNVNEEREERKIKDNTDLQEDSVYTKDESLENEISKDVDSNKIVETVNKDEESNEIFELEKEEKEVPKTEIADKKEETEVCTKEEEKAEVYTKKENAKGKEKEYIEMILKNPIDVKSYWKLGIVYSRRKNYKDAISCFRQITKIDPTYTKAKKKISDLVERMKEKKDNKKKVKKEKEIAKEDTKK
ncbi:tetratricopeptide repeat protein [Candidatus Parcubacteria bacterium]|nr:tetratricopeptide repeat protein [Candidatus Parcubacteria bacterium]